MENTIDHLASLIAEDQAAVDGTAKDMRSRVIRMGRRLRELQKLQKEEQAETGQTWEEWCAEQKQARGTFPESTNVRRYMLIARYPGAYKQGMSIKEAYRQAGAWKKNGGDPPLTEKKAIKARPLITIGAMAGKLERKIEALGETDFCEAACQQSWSDDEVLGATEALTLLRQSCNAMLHKLAELRGQNA